MSLLCLLCQHLWSLFIILNRDLNNHDMMPCRKWEMSLIYFDLRLVYIFDGISLDTLFMKNIMHGRPVVLETETYITQHNLSSLGWATLCFGFFSQAILYTWIQQRTAKIANDRYFKIFLLHITIVQAFQNILRLSTKKGRFPLHIPA